MKTEENKPNLNTPLVSVTLGDFCKAMLTVWEHSGNTEMDETNFGPRKLLHGIKELASFLGFLVRQLPGSIEAERLELQHSRPNVA